MKIKTNMCIDKSCKILCMSKDNKMHCAHYKGKPIIIYSSNYANALEAVAKAADDIGFPPLYRSLDGHKGTIKALQIKLARLKKVKANESTTARKSRQTV